METELLEKNLKDIKIKLVFKRMYNLKTSTYNFIY